MYQKAVFWIFGWTSYVGILLVAALECGYPGTPAYGQPRPVKETYKPGEAVSFLCYHGYTLQGPMQRVCLPNGTWAGHLPLCDRSLSTVEHLASSHHTLSMYPAENSIDGDPRTCTYTDKLRPRWIRVDMRQNYRVRAVAITVPANIYAQAPAHLTIYAISVRDSTTASYHKCAAFNGIFATTTLKLSCSGGEVEGRYIHIEDNRNRIDYFSLCEIQIFVNKGTYECGDSERPAHSYSSKTETGSVIYHCVHGYKLLGAATRHCLQDGQWSDYQPICQEIICPPIDEIKHGRISYVSRQKEQLTLGTMINVSCDYGYRTSGSPLQCEESGQWSQGNLACEPIDCGVPSVHFDSEQYILLNGTTYGGVAIQRCGLKETMLVCREDGTWSPSDLDCAEQSVLSKLGLVEEEQNDVPIGILIGMAVVVLLLLLLVILVLLMKRKKVFRCNSADSLPSKETGSTLAATSPQPYENDAFYATIPVDNHDSAETKKTFMSTILFTKKKGSESNSTSTGKKDSVDSTSTQGCIYEEIGSKNKTKLTLRQNGHIDSLSTNSEVQPVYAQVDLDEKRRSRLVKTLTDHFEPVDPPSWENTYRAEESPSFDDVDLEPIKLRELPPIPDDSGSDITYASLCIPLDPPSFVRQSEHYDELKMNSVESIMKDNELYS